MHTQPMDLPLTATTPTPAPLAVTPTWLAVMDRAGHVCECTGTCGNLHSKSGRRCDRANSPQHQLSAGPADPLIPAETAARLPADQLNAWCPTCWDGTRRRYRASTARAEARQHAEDDTLF